ncbi:hypothetical protein I317_01420 [Kwoniella heveanensis CBS 569]|uniref:Uncharacterized protein n=1 Tax=Kwoniella heveanensis BCC8398 TaxID=1296120 RepID=A0A1B9GKG9_9TREE|nr:hypothetical protein I316_06894 [Kwoniella heveanensis BCC8398]OCF44731.1 hypothetical protein I317_01420 [Kwoniella heveanensis CBS 569]
MRPTSILAGASRLPLTSKRANKDFYKGTGQSRVPGGGHRTGPPGVHVVRGKAKYRVLDEKVRVFIGPGAQTLEQTELRPYVATQQLLSNDDTRFFNPFARSSADRPKLPSFSPNALPPTSSSEGESEYAKPTKKDFTAFSKRYQRLDGPQKQALIMDARRNWFNEMSRLYGGGGGGVSAQQVQVEEQATRNVEERAAAAGPTEPGDGSQSPEGTETKPAAPAA